MELSKKEYSSDGRGEEVIRALEKQNYFLKDKQEFLNNILECQGMFFECSCSLITKKNRPRLCLRDARQNLPSPSQFEVRKDRIRGYPQLLPVCA